VEIGKIAMARYVQVLVDNSGGRTFDYALPAGLADLVPGARVRVPVRTRTAVGTVLEQVSESPHHGIREILEVISADPVLSPVLIQLGKWIADYYCCPLETALKAVLPNVIRKHEVTYKERLHARLVAMPEAAAFEQLEKRSPRQADVLRHLHGNNGAQSAAAVAEACGVAYQTLSALAKKGYILMEPVREERDPFSGEQFVASPALTLNAEQAEALKKVVGAIEAVAGATTVPKPILLHGVTGSGKTEIYLQAIQHALDRGFGAIMLVPEISLTPQTVERFKSRFAGTGTEVAVLHSHLGDGERHDEWHRIRDGRARIVVGARSAIFAPVTKLGLIVVDEEHENSYKQEESPKYQGRDLAVVRGAMERCAVLLGSATPSLESYQNTVLGKYDRVELLNRVDMQRMPRIRIMDMRQESRRGASILAIDLVAAIQGRLERKEQVILFLNRRGYSTMLKCGDCEHVLGCPNCALSLTFHRTMGRVTCHMCGYSAVAPKTCEKCKGPAIRYNGLGTEKVEEAVQKLFENAVVRRRDADVMVRREQYRETLDAFRTGKIDILVGTQMIAKGLHFPNVTLVGIVNADMGLLLPDFRAAERTFQLLTQVAGRAGRGEIEGDVFVQSGTPFHPAIQFARHHDFIGFFEQEIAFRQVWEYPPFRHLTLVQVRSAHQERARFTCETVHRRLREALAETVWMSEPGPAPLEKSHGNWRYQIALRTKTPLRLSRDIRVVLDKLPMPDDVFATVDVDAYQLM
jgi:primosomal protein N' (replication factor Y)